MYSEEPSIFENMEIILSSKSVLLEKEFIIFYTQCMRPVNT